MPESAQTACIAGSWKRQDSQEGALRRAPCPPGNPFNFFLSFSPSSLSNFLFAVHFPGTSPTTYESRFATRRGHCRVRVRIIHGNILWGRTRAKVVLPRERKERQEKRASRSDTHTRNRRTVGIGRSSTGESLSRERAALPAMMLNPRGHLSSRRSILVRRFYLPAFFTRPAPTRKKKSLGVYPFVTLFNNSWWMYDPLEQPRNTLSGIASFLLVFCFSIFQKLLLLFYLISFLLLVFKFIFQY